MKHSEIAALIEKDVHELLPEMKPEVMMSSGQNNVFVFYLDLTTSVAVDTHEVIRDRNTGQLVPGAVRRSIIHGRTVTALREMRDKIQRTIDELTKGVYTFKLPHEEKPKIAGT